MDTLAAFYSGLGKEGCARLESIAMDMWAPYIASTREHVPDVDRKIVFGKFHIAKHLGRAVDQVRIAENRELVSDQLRVARAWAIRESAMKLWGYVRRGWAERAWKGWYDWAIRSRLEPIKRVARLIKYYWDGVMTAATTNVTNARSEGMSSKIQWIKRMACSYRNRMCIPSAELGHSGALT
jgi:transposase